MMQIPDAAQQMLNTWDQFINGEPCSDMVKADVDLLIKAACFAAQAYEDMIASPITADAAPGTLLRIFLTAIVDPASKELDPYRAKNRPDATLTNEGTKPVDVAAVLNSAALIVEGRSTAINSDFIQKLAKKNAHEIATLITEHDKELGAAIRALSAAPAQGEQWRDMKDAPRTGEEIIYLTKYGEIGFCKYTLAMSDDEDDLWWDFQSDADVYPNYWLPRTSLPAAPTPEAGR